MENDRSLLAYASHYDLRQFVKKVKPKEDHIYDINHTNLKALDFVFVIQYSICISTKCNQSSYLNFEFPHKKGI